VFGDDAVGGDRRDRTLCRQRSVVQLCRVGAASAGVGGQSGARRHYAARIELAALDHGGSGASSNAVFAGGQEILRTAVAQEAQARGASGASAQTADRSLRTAARRRHV